MDAGYQGDKPVKSYEELPVPSSARSEALYAETAVCGRELAHPLPLRLRTNASDPLLGKFTNHKARARLQNQSSTLSGDSRAGLLCNRKG